MSTLLELTSLEAWRECVASSHEAPVLILKHSTRCPISTGAHRAYSDYCTQATGVTCYLVKVIENRPVSNAIAEETGIRHESPQLHLLLGGESLWQASHRDITVENIRKAVERLLGAGNR